MAKDFAIIKTGGKQYRVMAGQKLVVEKLGRGAQAGAGGTAHKDNAASANEPIIFDKVLLRSAGGDVEIGAPHIAGATVEAKLLSNFRDKTKIVFKYHSKARYKKKKGHRQPQTEVEITKI